VELNPQLLININGTMKTLRSLIILSGSETIEKGGGGALAGCSCVTFRLREAESEVAVLGNSQLAFNTNLFMP
jgi:hypothetical protein